MADPYHQNYFGDNYYNFEGNQSNNFPNSRMRPQLGQRFPPKRAMNFGHQNNNFDNQMGGPVNNNPNNYYRRTQHPYYGPKAGGTSGGHYRAQVIDYSSGPQSQPNYESVPRIPTNRFPNNGHHFGQMDSKNSLANNMSQHSMSRLQSSLLPIPQHPYPNIRAYGQPSHSHQPNQHNLMQSQPNPGFLPMPTNQMSGQRFGSRPPQPQHHTNLYPPNNQSFTSNYSQSVPQPVPQPVPKPVPQPVPPPHPAPVPPVSKSIPNPSQSLINNIKVEPNLEKQQKENESRIQSIITEGMERRVQNDLNGFYCLFCEVFCNNVLSAERHVESPKHQRTKIGDNLKGIDAKFTIKSERIRETGVALARKEELNKISNVIKNEYYNEGIRLKDGIGSDAYVCENCGVPIDSLAGVTKHLETHKQFSDQLKICSKPVIGLDFIVEYIDPDPSKERVYECTMCRTFHSTREIISHVCSFIHRTNFIRKIHPSEGHKYTSETQQLSLDAGKRALELETLIGRGQFRVKQMSAPQNCFANKSTVKSIDATAKRAATPQDIKPLVCIELPKQKSDQEKSDLEKLFSVKLDSESDANDVTKVISELTHSVMDYHMKDMTPDMREQFKKQLNNKEQTSFN